ncbi:hypothetical protein K1T71_014319 [Dendrolimus kikuchii]|uniref:Uncharacterized protein n=1 Tax=Dendrolimus kikuchii TaxID=765133 RepID=A0ACC1CFY0_9NEOP|nr:hypothetical protein K1T71_014319 [Dendrolimus kikuchii]
MLNYSRNHSTSRDSNECSNLHYTFRNECTSEWLTDYRLGNIKLTQQLTGSESADVPAIGSIENTMTRRVALQWIHLLPVRRVV